MYGNYYTAILLGRAVPAISQSSNSALFILPRRMRRGKKGYCI